MAIGLALLLAYVGVSSSTTAKDHMSGGPKARVRCIHLDAVGKNLIESVALISLPRVPLLFAKMKPFHSHKLHAKSG